MPGRTRSVLLVASAGGHLEELEVLAERLVPPGWDHTWLVPPGTQARQLARHAPVHLLYPSAPRDLPSLARNLPASVAALRLLRPDAVVSTGAVPALPALAAARFFGHEAHYIESAARTSGPSLTGRALRPLPGVHRYTQWPGWASPGWAHAGSVLDGFAVVDGPPRPVRRAVVTLGTQPGFGFRRLVERLIELLPGGPATLWQTGSTDTAGLPIEGRRTVERDELSAAMTAADVVVAHAGIGSLLSALRAGRHPVLVPRRAAHGEHVDDHQQLLADGAASLDIATVRQVDELVAGDLEHAAGRRAVTVPGPPLHLAGLLGEALGAVGG